MVISGLGQGPEAGCWEHGNEHSDSIKHSTFLNKMSGHQIVEKESAPWSY
jgi:hypothetical protein